MFVPANFMDIYFQRMHDRTMRSRTELMQEIKVTDLILTGGKFVSCYSEARNPVSHTLVHNSCQVYFQLFFVVFIRKSYKCTQSQSIKHQYLTGNINL